MVLFILEVQYIHLCDIDRHMMFKMMRGRRRRRRMVMMMMNAW
jgi:hypothetical protein